MKFNGKHIAITAGLGAVLALSPVVGPMATAFAQSNNGAAATQAQGHFVGFRITDPETGAPVDFPNYTTDGNETVDSDKIPTVPSYEDWEFVGWEDTETGKVYSASDLTRMVIWEDMTFQTKWNYVGQGEPRSLLSRLTSPSNTAAPLLTLSQTRMATSTRPVLAFPRTTLGLGPIPRATSMSLAAISSLATSSRKAAR